MVAAWTKTLTLLPPMTPTKVRVPSIGSMVVNRCHGDAVSQRANAGARLDGDRNAGRAPPKKRLHFLSSSGALSAAKCSGNQWVRWIVAMQHHLLKRSEGEGALAIDGESPRLTRRCSSSACATAQPSGSKGRAEERLRSTSTRRTSSREWRRGANLHFGLAGRPRRGTLRQSAERLLLMAAV